MNEQSARQATQKKAIRLNIELAPVNNSDHATLINFTRVNRKQAITFIDFGFLEPEALDALSRIAVSGGKIPEKLTGRLAVRVALDIDALVALQKQLGQVVGVLKAQRIARSAISAARKGREHRKCEFELQRSSFSSS